MCIPLTPEDELRIWCYLHKTFLSALRFARRRPFDSLFCSSSRGQALRRKEKGISFRYPAFTSQRVRKTAPTLTRHAGLLSGRPYRGLGLSFCKQLRNPKLIDIR